MSQNVLLAIIEDPKGSKAHVEFNTTTQQYEVVHKFLIPWPFHYGFLKDTYVSIDGDPLDIAIFSELQTQTGQEMLVRIIGALLVKDGDHKIFAVCPDDGQFGNCFEFTDLPESLRVESENIFKKGGHIIERVLNAEESMKLIELYRI
jgi:inorganic pyrophosphatase